VMRSFTLSESSKLLDSRVNKKCTLILQHSIYFICRNLKTSTYKRFIYHCARGLILAKINILNRILPGKLGVCILAKRDPPSNACQLYGNPKFRTTIKSHMVYGSSKWTWAKQMKNAINQHA